MIIVSQQKYRFAGGQKSTFYICCHLLSLVAVSPQEYLYMILYSNYDCMCRNSVPIEDWSEFWSKLSEELLYLSTEVWLCEEGKASRMVHFNYLLFFFDRDRLVMGGMVEMGTS